jgi:hypothetical protein
MNARLQNTLLALLLSGSTLAISSTASAQAPPLVPVEGYIAELDGTPIDGDVDILFTLYASQTGTDVLHSESQTVTFADGTFTAAVGAGAELDLDLFATANEVWLGITLPDDTEMDRIRFMTAPYAAFANRAMTADSAADAETVGGLGPDAFATTAHGHAFTDLTDVPAGLDDGDDDTTYTAGSGLALADGIFSLTLACDDGDLLTFSAGDWSCAPAAGVDTSAVAISSVSFDGSTLTIVEGERTLTVGLNTLNTDDADADPENELIREVRLNGSFLIIRDDGNTFSVNLGDVVEDLSPLNELISGIALEGTTLRLTEAGTSFTVNLASLVNDADASPTNELITDLSLSGTTLGLTEAGTTRTVSLAGLIPADGDSSATNELISSFELSGTTLGLTEAGTTRTVSLAGLIPADGDSSPTNELQTLSTNGNGEVTISGAGGNTVNVLRDAMALSINLGSSYDDHAGRNPVVVASGDDASGRIDLPFTVSLDGNSYSQLTASTNGWATFAGTVTSSDFSNDPLPTGAFSNPTIFPYWDDLTGTVSWFSEGTAGGRVVHVVWNSTTLSGGNLVRFELQIHEGSNALSVRYYSMAPAALGHFATIGYQGAGGSSATGYTIGFNAVILDDNSDDADPSDQGWSIAPVR